MKIIPIGDVLPGETLLAVHPNLQLQVDAGWSRRLNYHVGRSLTGHALAVEQEGRAGHLATLGQALSPGVHSGLDVYATRGSHPQLVVAPGMGLANSGEDVTVSESWTIDWRGLEVFVTDNAPPSLIEAIQLQRHAARRIESDEGPILLGDWVASENSDGSNPRPPVGVLVLEPVVYRRIEDFDPDDQCPRDLKSEAFEDRQWIDGCRLAFHAWHSTWIIPYDESRWRNRLANAVFESELLRRPDQIMPWERLGVPIALLGFTPDNRLAFVDRHSVVRAAGKPKPRRALVTGQGESRLWKARVDQFATQMAEQLQDGVGVAEVAYAYDFLPPFGVLPQATVQLTELDGGRLRRILPRQRFFREFSSQLQLRIVPVATESLDAALRASYGQAPYKRGQPDEMQVLVPVPQRHYDPRLLVIETIDEVFGTTIDNHVKRRGEWLQRRAQVRRLASEVVRAIAGKGIDYPDVDPNRLEPETVGTDPLAPTEPTFDMVSLMDAKQVQPPTDSPAQATVAATYDPATDRLALEFQLAGIDGKQVTEIQLRVGAEGENGALLTTLPAGFQVGSDGICRHELDNIAVPDDRRSELQSGQLYVTLLTTAHPNGAIRGQVRLAARDALEVQLQGIGAISNEVERLEALGVHRFIDRLESIVKSADDAVDMGFSATNAVLYKVRQLMLGSSDASRLATSPALAAIAVQGETAATKRDEIRTFVNKLQLKTVPKTSSVSSDSVDARATISARDIFRPGSVGLGEVIFDPDAIEPRTPRKPTKAAPLKPVTQAVHADKSVLDQLYLVGKAELPRNVTIGERLRYPEANEAKNAAVSVFYDVVKSVVDLELNVDDLTITGIAVLSDGEPKLVPPLNRRVERGRTDAAALKENRAELNRILQDPDPPNPDESDFYSSAIDIIEHAIALLRRVEGRIQQYRAAIASSQEVLAELQDLAGQADQRLKLIADELAEARHDVAVARALRDEEQARIDAINLHRDNVVAQNVKFLAYHRTRLVIPVSATPARRLDPVLLEEPVPTCLGADVDVPEELRSMVDLLRDAPVKWFPGIAKLLEKLDQPKTLERSLVIANRRAQAQVLRDDPVGFQESTTRFGQMIGKVYSGQRRSVERFRAKSARANLVAIAPLGWKATQEKARELVSLGDLLDSDHARSEIVQRAADELDSIARVATCLYREVGEVPAALRLVWAESISQFDEPIDLSELSRLPMWGDRRIDFALRTQLQTLNRWLFSRADQNEKEAVGLMSDVVRVCILLASHAPVKRILSGRIEEPTPARPGATVLVRPNTPDIKIGMPVFMFKADRIVARAIVADLSEGRATTRIVRVFESNVTLDRDDAVRFGPGEVSATRPSSRFYRLS